MPRPAKVLFVCIGNSCRSQMAEALARLIAPDVIAPSSAGIAPLGIIAEPTRTVLEERGARTDGQYSKGLRVEDRDAADLVVNMTGWPSERLFAASDAPVEDWDIADPYGEDLELYRRIRDEIEQHVTHLAERLRAKQKSSGG